MDKKSSKEIISSFFKDKGFVSTSSKRLFFQDCGFYLIIVEIIPVGGNLGLLLNVGVMHLWSTYYGIVYNHPTDGGCQRIHVLDHPLGALMFDNPNADSILNQLMVRAMKEINKYRELRNFSVFKKEMEIAKDYLATFNPGDEKKDLSIAISHMFSGEASKAAEILHTAYTDCQTREVEHRLLEKCGDIESFQETLLDIVNNCRKMLSKKYKVKLEPITYLWNS